MKDGMNVSLLIDAIVRQTTVLIAQLATAAGVRAPLAHMANQVFMDLVRELRVQGLAHKVIAEMFGLSLRTYHNQVARLSEGRSERGRSLWAAVLGYLQERPVTTRSQVLSHFHRDDDATIRGVLRDLTDSGMIYRSGKGDAVSYRVADLDEHVEGPDPAEALSSLVWVAINRFGPVTATDLASHVPAKKEDLDDALKRLLDESKIDRIEGSPEARYSCTECLIPMGNEAGWEAAVFDHYQAMVTAICTKLRSGATAARKNEWIGGSTYGYDVWPGHPLFDEVVAFLQETRERSVELRARVEAINDAQPEKPEHMTRVITYVGQTVIQPEVEPESERGG